jgi:hypothetical protein
MIQRGSLRKSAVLALGLSLGPWLGCGCSREGEKPARHLQSNELTAAAAIPAPPGPLPALPASNSSLSNPAANQAMISNSVPAADTNRSPEQIKLLAQYKVEYAAAASFDDRFDVVLKIAEAKTADSVVLLEQLFREEKDKDLRVELINGLMGMDSCKEERMAFLKLGISREQPPEVREAAVDGLVDLAESRALEVLRGLCSDADPAIARLAKESVTLMEKMLQ